MLDSLILAQFSEFANFLFSFFAGFSPFSFLEVTGGQRLKNKGNFDLGKRKQCCQKSFGVETYSPRIMWTRTLSRFAGEKSAAESFARYFLRRVLFCFLEENIL